MHEEMLAAAMDKNDDGDRIKELEALIKKEQEKNTLH